MRWPDLSTWFRSRGPASRTPKNPRGQGERTPQGIARGWYEFIVEGAPDSCTTARLLLDFGRGYSAFHSITLWRQAGRLGCVARLYLDVLAFRLALTDTPEVSGTRLEIRRIGLRALIRRRFCECVVTIVGSAGARRLRNSGWKQDHWASRYLTFSGFFSFPLMGAPQSDYAEWIFRNEILPETAPPPVDSVPLHILVRATMNELRYGEAVVDGLLRQMGGNDRLTIVLPPGASTAIWQREVERWPGAAVSVTHDADGEDVLAACRDSRAGEWLVLIREGAVPNHRLLEQVRTAVQTSADAIAYFGGSDRMDAQGSRKEPSIPMGFSSEWLKSGGDLGPVVILSKSAAISALASTPAIETDLEWLLMLAERFGDRRFGSIDAVLAHRTQSSAGAALPETHVETVRRHLARFGADEVVEYAQGRTRAVLRYPLSASVSAETPFVSIIMPTKDRADLLMESVGTILTLSTLSDFELIIVDHETKEPAALRFMRETAAADARVKLTSYSGPFNYSEMCNRAAIHARGSMLAFVNNDISVRSTDWLETLGGLASRPRAGCVGPMLLYPDNRIQQAGIALGIGGVAANLASGMQQDDRRIETAVRLPRTVSAVSGACLVIRRATFEHLEGFDERNLPVAFNDVDLCLRAIESGCENLWTPDAVLVHRESATRGDDDVRDVSGRFVQEVSYMRARWGKQLDGDPFYPSLYSLKNAKLALRV